MMPLHLHLYEDSFEEAKHPRGQPENKGQFAPASAHGTTGRTQPSGEALPEHIAKLRIPPAWTEVKYNPDPNGALLAVGKDAKGREQHLYSASFSGTQAEAKFRRIEELNNKFTQIKSENDANRQDKAKREVADVLMLIMATGIRPGSDKETLADKHAYGATTLEGKHVVSDENGVRLQFVGKKGVNIDIPVNDAKVASMLQSRAKHAGPGGKLFPKTTDGKLLGYVHSLDGGSFKTKDFRTLLGTRLAMREIKNFHTPRNAQSYKKQVMAIAKKVAQALGNTPAIALQSYISPEIFSRWRITAHV